MANKNKKNVHDKVEMKNMFIQLKSDLRNGENVSYGSMGISMLVNGDRVEWEFKANRLYRHYGIGSWTVSSERVYSFKYQGLFTGYMAFEIVTGDGPMFDIIQVH